MSSRLGELHTQTNFQLQVELNSVLNGSHIKEHPCFMFGSDNTCMVYESISKCLKLFCFVADLWALRCRCCTPGFCKITAVNFLNPGRTRLCPHLITHKISFLICVQIGSYLYVLRVHIRDIWLFLFSGESMSSEI